MDRPWTAAAALDYSVLCALCGVQCGHQSLLRSWFIKSIASAAVRYQRDWTTVVDWTTGLD